jgi:hypothetical protein
VITSAWAEKLPEKKEIAAAATAMLATTTPKLIHNCLVKRFLTIVPLL